MTQPIPKQSFLVNHLIGVPDEWLSTDTISYSFGVGPSGDLMIFKAVFNPQFNVQTEDDVRWYNYAPSTWHSVEVLDDSEIEESDGEESV
jgi:hypothetical protein